MTSLKVNNKIHQCTSSPETPLLYVLRNELGLKGPKFGCGLEQCNSCKVLVDGQDVPSCQLPISHVEDLEIITIEGLGTLENLHPLQEAFIEEQAIQCGYCVTGMIMAAQGLLNRTRYPSDEEIQEALEGNLCRCGVHERVRRAIKMRIGQPIWDPIYEVITPPSLPLTDEEKDDLRSIETTPALDNWIQTDVSETVTVFTGKVEIGQGIKTAVSQLAAEELDVSPERIRVVTADTEQTPNEGATAGSMSVEMSGMAVRMAAAEARQYLLKLAFEELEAETIDQLIIKDGMISDPQTGKQVSYWELHGGKLFGINIQANTRRKDSSQYKWVGQPEKRTDLIAKVTGQPVFLHDLELTDMVHGRIVRPPRYHASLKSLDKAVIEEILGVIQVVQDGSFLGVIAEEEYQAVLAMEKLRETAVWHDNNPLPDVQNLPKYMKQQESRDHHVIKGVPQMDTPIPPIKAPPTAKQTIMASYSRPFHMHGSLSPSTAVAHWENDKLTVWSHSQAVFRLRDTLATALELDKAQIRVIHAEASGCYGHNGADDVALDAALLSKAVHGRPVSVKWMREDEHAWEPYGSAMVMDLQASLDDGGNVMDWNHDVWSYSHMTRPGGAGDGSSLMAMRHLDRSSIPPQPMPTRWPEAAEYRNLSTGYTFENERTVRHFIRDNPLRVSALRTLGAYANVYAIESFMDELAHTANVDPVQFRLNHLADERAKAVIKAVAQKASWKERPFPQANGIGRGIAYGQYKNRQCYTAVIIEVEVTDTINVKRVIIAADAGEIVNPDGLSNQLEGGAIQALSWTLFEAVTWNSHEVTSRDWDTYPILRFPDAPKIETVLLNRPERPFLGVGEASQGPTAAALANAIFDATGKRLRDMPLKLSP